MEILDAEERVFVIVIGASGEPDHAILVTDLGL